MPPCQNTQETRQRKECIFLNHPSVVNLQPIQREHWRGRVCDGEGKKERGPRAEASPPTRASPHALLRKSAGDLGSQAGGSYLFHKHLEVLGHPRPFCCYCRLLKKKRI